MRIAVLVLIILLSSSINIFGQSEPVTHGTMNILTNLRNLGEDISELRFYLSRPFNIIVLDENNEVPGVTIRNGSLVNTNQGQPVSYVIYDDDGGKMISIPESGTDIIEIVFQTDEKLIPVKFKRNPQLNLFVVISATIDTREYSLHSQSNLPHLLIRSYLDPSTSEVYAFLASQEAASQEAASQGQNAALPGENQGQSQGSPQETLPPVPPQTSNQQQGTRTRNILGIGSITPGDFVSYLIAQNPEARGVGAELIAIYVREAHFEGVNHDIAIVQMLHATNFLKNRDLMVNHNYAGFINTDHWFGRFNDMTMGVRAHIQHLKGYATNELPRNDIVAPRYYILANLGYLGTVTDFDSLYRVWSASSSRYKSNIDRILADLYR